MVNEAAEPFFFFQEKKKKERKEKRGEIQINLGLFCELLSLAWPTYNTWRKVSRDACFVGCVVRVR